MSNLAINSLRQQFELRATQVGATIVSPAGLRSLLQGKVFVSQHPLCYPWRSFASCDDVREADVSLTGCDALVAETGSAFFFSTPVETRVSTLTAPIHIIVAAESQVARDMESVFELFAERLKPGSLASSFFFVTGASRTTDIEKTLVLGVHGPKKLVFAFASPVATSPERP